LQRWTPEGGFARESLVFITRLALSVVLLVLSVALLVGATNNAFIYTRF
jgi:alginate O-acetyltransferase complex protein AlgI